MATTRTGTGTKTGGTAGVGEQRKAELARELEMLCEQLQRTRATIASHQALEVSLCEKIVQVAAELDPGTREVPTQITLGSLRLSITPEAVIKRRTISIEAFEKYIEGCPKQIRQIAESIYRAVLVVKKTHRRAIIRIS